MAHPGVSQTLSGRLADNHSPGVPARTVRIQAGTSSTDTGKPVVANYDTGQRECSANPGVDGKFPSL